MPGEPVDPKNNQTRTIDPIEQDLLSRLQHYYQEHEITPVMRDNIHVLARGYRDASSEILRNLSGMASWDFAAPIGTDNVAKRLAFQRMRSLLDNANPIALKELKEPGAAETTWKLMAATDTAQYLGAHGHQRSNLVRLLNSDTNQEVQRNVFEETKRQQEEVRDEVEKRMQAMLAFRRINRVLNNTLEPGQKPLGSLMYLDEEAILPLIRRKEEQNRQAMAQRTAFVSAVSNRNTPEEPAPQPQKQIQQPTLTRPELAL